ncbi:hypothetical protein SAMN02910339_01316 [Lachnospiraceae bacterium YSD2013]|nr:hypothetical protein SAMN02910339_01316 [Lachnospiraceae bacterium YSD2013]
MINTEITTTKGIEQAQKQMEQAKNRLAMEKKKANEERRKRENHHKYMMGGVIHKYFPECYCFEESEIDEIIRVAFRTGEVQKTISGIKARANQVLSSPAESEVKAGEFESNESR